MDFVVSTVRVFPVMGTNRTGACVVAPWTGGPWLYSITSPNVAVGIEKLTDDTND